MHGKAALVDAYLVAIGAPLKLLDRYLRQEEKAIGTVIDLTESSKEYCEKEQEQERFG